MRQRERRVERDMWKCSIIYCMFVISSVPKLAVEKKNIREKTLLIYHKTFQNFLTRLGYQMCKSSVSFRARFQSFFLWSNIVARWRRVRHRKTSEKKAVRVIRVVVMVRVQFCLLARMIISTRMSYVRVCLAAVVQRFFFSMREWAVSCLVPDGNKVEQFNINIKCD